MYKEYIMRNKALVVLFLLILLVQNLAGCGLYLSGSYSLTQIKTVSRYLGYEESQTITQQSLNSLGISAVITFIDQNTANININYLQNSVY